MSELSSNEAEAIKADIEQTRAELAATTDALATKLDVKAQARTKAQAAGAGVSRAYQSARSSMPEPVQRAWSKAGTATSPLAAKAAEDKRRTALVAAAVIVAALVVRRFTR
jgi:hypothetical protein